MGGKDGEPACRQAGKILMVAGEASGDLHGARLAKILLQKRDRLRIIGIGGDKMKESGVELIYHIRDLGVVGIIEVLYHLKAIRAAFGAIRRLIETDGVDLVILIDYPDFNLRVAKMVEGKETPVIYYISPQIWAWRGWRIKKIARLVDKMIVILPFEEKIYRDAGVDAEFVGHPLLDDLDPSFNKGDFCKRYGIDTGRPVIGLMPGSRKGEVRSMLPIMMDSAKIILKEIPDAQFLISAAATIEDKEIMDIVQRWPMDIKVIRDQSNGLIASSDIMIIKSGTATLQAAILGKPMVIVYTVSLITYLIGRLMIKVKHLGLVNIVAESEIVPELIQYNAVPEKIGRSIVHIMRDKKKRDEMIKDLSVVRSRLGTPGASRRAAEIVLKYI